MSELTRCNLCSLDRIAQRASARGATVSIIAPTDMPGWLGVKESDKEKPEAYFLELTTDSACRCSDSAPGQDVAS